MSCFGGGVDVIDEYLSHVLWHLPGHESEIQSVNKNSRRVDEIALLVSVYENVIIVDAISPEGTKEQI